MFELTAETRIAELQEQSPAIMAALLSTTIFHEGDDAQATIDDLCRGVDLHPDLLLNILRKAQAAETPTEIDVSELDGLTLTQVVENIEASHHAYLREMMPATRELIGRVVTAHGARDDRLATIRTLFGKMSADLENHMRHEEEALFPMVRDMECDGAIKPTRCGDQVGGPIACMENDHIAARAELGRLRELTNNYAVPAHACMTYRKVLEQLSAFDQNTVVHMHKEDNVLFPGAVKKQGALREG